MDVIHWWLAWPTWVQDVSVVLAFLIFLGHGTVINRSRR